MARGRRRPSGYAAVTVTAGLLLMLVGSALLPRLVRDDASGFLVAVVEVLGPVGAVLVFISPFMFAMGRRRVAARDRVEQAPSV